MKSVYIGTFFVVFSIVQSVCGADFHISPSGSDDQPGTKEKPFATLEKARDAVRQSRKNAATDAFRIELAPGRYFLDRSFVLEKQDSVPGNDEKDDSNPNLLFVSEKPFAAELIGGVRVPATAFKRPTDKSVLERLDASVRNKILVADLNALGIPAMPQWSNRFRGRPNAGPELFLNDEPMTLARWPNEGWAGFKTTIDDGMPHGDQTDENRAKVLEKAGVAFVHPEVDTTKKHGGAFLFDEDGLKIRDPDRIARWRVDEGVWLCGYWTHDWSDEVLKVEEIDTKNRTIRLEGVHGYGIGGRSWTGYSERRYFALNLLEELDMPGEWYLDRAANLLYFYPPKRLSEKDSILLSTLDRPLVELNEVAGAGFQGISFGPTFAGAISIQGGENNLVAGCRIRNTGRHGISIVGGRRHRVRSCDLYNIGSVGVSIVGGDRKTLTPAGHEAANNHVYRFGRLQRTYAGAFSLQGVGNTLVNNRIHSGPHLAVSYGGNENRIIRNEIYDVVLETSDAGAMYTGRDWTTQGNLIEENFVHHLGTSDSHGTMGVYLDDCDCGDTIRRNLFYKAGRAVFIGGGRDNIAQYNLFVECYQGIALDARGMTWKQWNTPGDGWNLEEKAERLRYKDPPWSERYPKLASIMENEPKAPLGCRFTDNVMIDCVHWMSLDGNVLKLLERTDIEDKIIVAGNLVVENRVESKKLDLPEKERKLQTFVKNVEPDFVDPVKLNFRMKNRSPLAPILPEGFEPIPLDRIGLYVDRYRKTVPDRVQPGKSD